MSIKPKILALSAIVAAMVSSSLIVNANPEPERDTYDPEPLLVELARTQERERKLDAWVDELVQLESGGREDIVILDVNNRHSYGCLQYQAATFAEFQRRYGISGDIMDCNVQRRLTKATLLENPRNARHWYTSVYIKGLGEPEV